MELAWRKGTSCVYVCVLEKGGGKVCGVEKNEDRMESVQE